MSAWAVLIWPLAALLLAWLLVRAALRYTRRRGMLDLPGHRRSHTLPTPRGGGIGVVLALLLCLPGALRMLQPAWPWSLVWSLELALALVAGVGWWDDRRSLPVLPRLLAQLAAVGLVAGALVQQGMSPWWLLVVLPAGVWSINLHNFMDGIDGLLALQVMFVASALGLMAWFIGQAALASACGVLALATAGFWVFNRPPARIFMGDVGSGSEGLMIFACSVVLWRLDATLIWPVLVLSSAFTVDAGLTLASRMLRGRRWYTAHREHLYQWLVRRGWSHGATGVAYAGWNLLVAAPMAWWAVMHPASASMACVLVHMVGAGVWLLLKRRLARRPCLKV